MNTANATGTRSQWEGRIGVDFVGKMGGCCAATLQAWKPQSPGQRNSCGYCGSTMKTIRAGREEDQSFRGGLNEHLVGVKKEELVIGGLFFTSDRFASPSHADTWMDDREIAAKAQPLDMHAQYAHLEALRPETTRAIWVAPGVVGQIGVAKQDAAATGAGQASMHSPGITTTSMATGGTSHPTQSGPPALAVGQNGMPTLVTGMVEMNDGHQHEFNLVPYPAADGWRVKGFTSFNNGHSHYIEASLNDDGTLDIHTNPDQSPVGGHAHRHRATWMPGVAAALPKAIADEAVYERSSKEYRVTSQDVVLLKRASGMIQSFCKNLCGPGDDDLGVFREKMSEAIERARGQVAHREGFLHIEEQDIQKLSDCAEFVAKFTAQLIGGLGMEKDASRPFDEEPVEKAGEYHRPSEDELDAASDAAGMGNPGNVNALIDWVGEVGFTECVERIRGSERASARVDDPMKVCGWLKGQAGGHKK
jgi:hypothetical protein